MSEILLVKNAQKTYGKTIALDRVSMSILKGEFITLLGPSGSGKSTLLMTIGGFSPLDGGGIFYNGRSLNGVPAEKRNFGMVFQGYALFPHMMVSENIAYPLKVRKFSKDLCARRVAEVLKQVQLSGFENRLPATLSGGQQQRVALARAISFRPEVLLLDEPLGALDKQLRQQVQGELKQLHKSIGSTFINVTHDQEEAMAMSDRIAIMNAGRIVQIGTGNDLYRQPNSKFVASFLGKCNFIRCSIVRSSDGKVDIVTENGIRSSVHSSSEMRTEAGMKAWLCVRPENTVVTEAAVSNFPAVISSVTDFGSFLEVRCVPNSGGEIIAHLRENAYTVDLNVGGAIGLTWKEAACALVPDD